MAAITTRRSVDTGGAAPAIAALVAIPASFFETGFVQPVRAPKRPIGSRPRVIPAIIPGFTVSCVVGRAQKLVASCGIQRTTNSELEKWFRRSTCGTKQAATIC